MQFLFKSWCFNNWFVKLVLSSLTWFEEKFESFIYMIISMIRTSFYMHFPRHLRVETWEVSMQQWVAVGPGKTIIYNCFINSWHIVELLSEITWNISKHAWLCEKYEKKLVMLRFLLVWGMMFVFIEGIYLLEILYDSIWAPSAYSSSRKISLSTKAKN